MEKCTLEQIKYFFIFNEINKCIYVDMALQHYNNYIIIASRISSFKKENTA